MKTLDIAWRTHLVNLEHLRRGINLRAYAQKNPLNEYKFEAFNIFQEMLHKIRIDVLTTAYGFELQMEPTTPDDDMLPPIEVPRAPNTDRLPPIEVPKAHNAKPSRVEEKQISRNAPCPCGSGKRYKHCHGALQSEYQSAESEDNASPEAEALDPIEKPTATVNEDPAKVLHDYIKEQREQVLTGKSSNEDEE